MKRRVRESVTENKSRGKWVVEERGASSDGLREEINREKALQAEEQPVKTEGDVNFIKKDWV